jgi:DNA-binding CsgD family transcriptional regulator
MKPEVKYAETSDGVKIAYFAIGRGPLLIDLLTPPVGNVDLIWHIDEFREQFEAIAQLITYVQFDPRGFGMSDREVEDFSLAAMVRDLEAVADAVGRERFALASWSQCAMPALAYAAAHPDRVIALALREGFASGENLWYDDLPLALAQDNWELFVRSMADRVQNMMSVAGLGKMHQFMRRTATPETFIRYTRAWQMWDVFDLLGSVTMPVLVTNDHGAPRDASRRLAAALPRGSLVTNDVPRGVPSPSEDAFREFLARTFMAEAASANVAGEAPPLDAGLTQREIEVLKLVVEGMSGKDIAGVLVLSPRTVERHIANIYRKTDTHGRAQLASFALRQRLV